ncbi:carbohydrate sulfotransferase 15-like [Bolinopsis microptera]|uniref:carbohydrate sulfotransferase 15-like n=1 Tax=Bolinopsis microptera TaxID=2820187 RepID=UPI00307A8EA7
MIRRPRNVVILVLVLLAGFHLILFVSQNYRLTISTGDQQASPKWEDNLSFPTFTAHDDNEHTVQTLTEYEQEAVTRDKVSGTSPEDKEEEEEPSSDYHEHKFERPPDNTVEEVFGSDIIKDEKSNYLIQKPYLKKGVNPYDGRPELLPRSEGINKYTAFGNPDKLYCDAEYCYANERKIKKEIIKETPEDMFTFLPPQKQFMKEFRNPCWKGKDLLGEDKLFCIPYFYIIGFTKCGTTDLFAILKNHTHVSSRSGKETHYFDRLRRGRIIRMNRKPTRLPVSFLSWTNGGKFRQNLLSTYRKDNDSDVLFHGITMDATPSAVWDNEFWEVFHPGYREPPVTNPDVIATINPDTRIILSLRNPISRMQSAYQFFCAFRVYACDKPVTPEKFHNLVGEAVKMFRDCRKTNTDRGCVYSTESHQLATHLYASIYSVYVADWLKVFPREQIHVMMFEEHISDEIASINGVCDFLGISRFPVDYMKTYLEQHKVRNSLRDSARIPYILPETKNLLKDFFKPFLDDLVEMLGDKKWYWKLYE